jgi:hypothetical protein
MLEPRVVAARPTSSPWNLDLSYEPDSESLNSALNLEDTVAATEVLNRTPPISTNGYDASDMEITSHSQQGIGTDEAPIDEDYLELARTFQALGRDRMQELVLLIE